MHTQATALEAHGLTEGDLDTEFNIALFPKVKGFLGEGLLYIACVCVCA